MILRLIWRNLWRNSRRTMITMASIAFAVLFAILMQSFQDGVFGNLIKNVVGYYSGYIQVHKKGYWDEQVIDNCFREDQKLKFLLNQTGQIHQSVPRLETFILASGGNTTKGCFLVGTDPVLENKMTRLKEKLTMGRYFTSTGDEVLLGVGLSKRLGLGVGDTLVLLGQGYQGVLAAGKYRICGLVKLSSPAMSDNFVYIPLESARYLLGAEGLLTSLSLDLRDPEQMEALASTLKPLLGNDYEVMTWEEMMPEIANHIRADGANFYIFTGILYLIIGFGLFGTILMMTAERRYELGMLMAIGMKRYLLRRMLLGETLMMTITGVLAGCALSLPLVWYLQVHPARLTGEVGSVYEQFGFEAIFPTVLDPGIFATQSAIVCFLALLVGLYPMYFVQKLETVKAMKK